ncbi:MAG: FAD-dependent oxidoreductase, partial [Muribaculaceae bacterium]|nr:FAD-dependent oxidoreductase [Muribaculaceae bacterium]
RVLKNEKITVLFNCNTLGLFGEPNLEGAKLVENSGTENEQIFDIAIDGFFLAIGHTPNTGLFKDQIRLDENGYIKLEPGSSMTNVDGVFAAGDVADPRYQQAISAAGMGCHAAMDAERYIMENDLL